tara:strand:- start:2474 stop:3271 length:798 start_codon:yes stop_codon:yes gene_type:complete
MTFIYWGAVDTGKHHLQEYAKANKKSFVTWRKTSAKKYSFTSDKQIREYYYTDETNRTEEDLSEYEEKFTLRKQPNYINYTPKNKNIKKSIKRDIFTDIKKCLPIDLLFPLYGNNKEIIKNWGHFTDENIQWFRTCNNIVPYKKDILDSAICKLDKFNEFVSTPYKHDVVKAYKENKNFIWIFLDNMIYNSTNYIEGLLKQYNIPYTYFSLDDDDYNSKFGWDVEIKNKELTHPKIDWHDEEKYTLIKDIAEEYIKYNTKGDTRL